MIFCYVEPCQKLLHYLRETFTFIVDEAFLQFQHDTVITGNKNLYYSLGSLDADGWCDVHLIFGVEVLNFVDRGNQVLETHHLKVVLTHV